MTEAEERRYLRNEVGVLQNNMRDVNRKLDAMATLLTQHTGIQMNYGSPTRRATADMSLAPAG